MSTTLRTAMVISQSSEELLRQAQNSLNGVDDFFRAEGVDPQTLRRVASELMTDEIEVEITKKLNEIEHEISREVSLKRREMETASHVPVSAGVKRPRPMV